MGLSCLLLSLLRDANLKGLKAEGERSEKIHCLSPPLGAGSRALQHEPAHDLQGDRTGESHSTCGHDTQVLCPSRVHTHAARLLCNVYHGLIPLNVSFQPSKDQKNL